MQCENEPESIFSLDENIFNVGFDLESWEKRLETHPELLVYAETDGFVIAAPFRSSKITAT